MKLLVFGATGKTGLCFVKQALDRGHDVTAFVRDPAKLQISHAKLASATGDILDAASVSAAFTDPFDAVISALGIFHREEKTDLSEGTRNIIEAMETHGCRRFAVVSSLGAGDSAGQGNLVARGLQRFLLNYVLADKTRQEALIEASGLDYTIARPPQLTDNDSICREVVAWQGPAPRGKKLTWKTSRMTVANFLLDALEQGTYSREILNISEPA